MSKPLRVAVVSVHPLTRAGLTQLLAADPGRAEVVEVAAMDGHLGGHDVVVYDLAGLGGNGGDLGHLLSGPTPVLGVAPLHRPDLVEGALALGVADVVPISVAGPELLAAVLRVAGGHVADRHRSHLLNYEALRSSMRLTEREIEILQLVAAGLSNQDIADRLYLSINSIKTYIRTAYRKIGVNRRSEAVLWAARHHLVPPVEPRRGLDSDRVGGET